MVRTATETGRCQNEAFHVPVCHERWTKGRVLERQPTERYRQSRRLTDFELKRLNALGPAARAVLVVDPAPRDRGGGDEDHAR
jgi:hypothetical protein